MTAWERLYGQVLAQVRDLGFEDLSAWSEANWDTDIVGLRDRLAMPDVRPFQLDLCLRAEAVAKRRVDRYLRGALVRNLNYKLPNGWGPDDDSAARAAWAVWSPNGDWATDAALAVSRYLREHHPPNWKPRDPDDPVLVAAFEAAAFPYDKVTSPFPIEPPASTLPLTPLRAAKR